jgi:hypothetical protein
MSTNPARSSSAAGLPAPRFERSGSQASNGGRPVEPRRSMVDIRMESYGGSAQPAPTIGQCLNDG